MALQVGPLIVKKLYQEVLGEAHTNNQLGLPLHPNRHLVHLLPTRLPRHRRNRDQTLQPPQMGHSRLRLQQHHQPPPPPRPISRRSRHPLLPRLLLRCRRPRQILLPRQRHDFKLSHFRPGP